MAFIKKHRSCPAERTMDIVSGVVYETGLDGHYYRVAKPVEQAHCYTLSRS